MIRIKHFINLEKLLIKVARVLMNHSLSCFAWRITWNDLQIYKLRQTINKSYEGNVVNYVSMKGPFKCIFQN